MNEKEYIANFLKLIAQLSQTVNWQFDISNNSTKYRKLLLFQPYIMKQSKSFACIPQPRLCVDKNDLRKE